MTKRGRKVGKSLFVSMLLTLTIALGGCAGDKEEGGASQVETTPGSEAVSKNNELGSAETESGEASQITIGIPQDLNSLDSNIAEGAGTREMLFNIYEGLYKADSEGNLVPAVASDYTV